MHRDSEGSHKPTTTLPKQVSPHPSRDATMKTMMYKVTGSTNNPKCSTC